MRTNWKTAVAMSALLAQHTEIILESWLKKSEYSISSRFPVALLQVIAEFCLVAKVTFHENIHGERALIENNGKYVTRLQSEIERDGCIVISQYPLQQIQFKSQIFKGYSIEILENTVNFSNGIELGVTVTPPEKSIDYFINNSAPGQRKSSTSQWSSTSHPEKQIQPGRFRCRSKAAT